MLERPAPFSVLPGNARLLLVLDPIMIELTVRGCRSSLRRHDAFAFAGDDPATLSLVDGPGRVLNLICRSDRWIPAVDRHASAPIGWLAWGDSEVAKTGDMMFGDQALPCSTSLHFVQIDRTPPVG